MQASHVETILADSVRTYLAGERDIIALPADRRQIVTYAQLMEDPRGVVERIYSGFGLPGPDSALRAALDKEPGAGRDRTSPHRYSLEEFGLTESRLRHDLAPVFERFDF
jgi:hypothetical protein